MPMPGGLGGFGPASIPGLVAWLDASDEGTITLNGGNVSQWSDKSGSRNHATQTTAANQPRYDRERINGRHAITWTTYQGTQRLTIAGLNLPTPTIFTVFREDPAYVVGGSNAPVVWDTFNPASGRFVLSHTETSRTNLYFQRGSGGGGEIASVNFVMGTLGVAVCQTLSAGQRIWANGRQGTPATTSTNGLLGLSIGALRGSPNTLTAAYTFLGQICEIVIYSQTVPEDQRAALEYWLANKWGIAL